ncbi:MAG: sel1 repeat family protein [Rhodospirillales bacterium]|nr:MAG: sel1 repeat family protein [Rhodospirillales bacterium]
MAAALFFCPPASAGPIDDALAARARGDHATALQLLSPLAEAGDRAAQYELGTMRFTGKGVPRDEGDAARWFGRAAERGDERAQRVLGVLFDNGWGVARDHAIAARWYRRAAEQGDPEAQYALGEMCANGRGVAIDGIQAYAWLSLAASRFPPEERRRVEIARGIVGLSLTVAQIAAAERVVDEWKPKAETQP